MPDQYNLHLKGDVGSWDFSADMVDWVLNRHKGETVRVLVDSLGGNAVDAMSISAYFKIHGDVEVHYVGMNASAATIASMGAKRITMDTDAMYLVHRCRFMIDNFDYCNAEQLQAEILKLQETKQQAEAIDMQIAAMYARRCKKTQDQLMELMKQERWLSAAEALEWGFVDEVTDCAEDKQSGPGKAKLAAMAKAGLPVPPISKSLFARIAEWFQGDGAYNDHSNKQHILKMTDFKSICEAAGIEDIEVIDGKATLSVDQLRLIEQRMQQPMQQQQPEPEQAKGNEQPDSKVFENSRGEAPRSQSFEDVAAEARRMFKRINY